MADEKAFSKEDLDMVQDESEQASGDEKGDAGDQGSDGAASEEKTGQDDGQTETKAEKSWNEAREEKRTAKRRDSIFDDDESGDDDAETGRSDDKSEVDAKDEDAAEKPQKTEPDWREKLIAKALKGQENELTAAKLEKRREALRRQFGRYKTPEDYMLAGLAAQEKLRSGEYRRAKLPPDATEDEIAHWRNEMGLPAKAGDYEIPKVAGHQWTEQDAPFVDSFKEAAFGANLDQEQMNRLTQWYARNLAEQTDNQLEKIADLDRADMEHLEDDLRAELGAGEYRPTKKLVQRLLTDKDQGIGAFEKQIREARYPDDEGNYRRLISHPQFTRWLIDLALNTYGDAALISGDARDTVSNRLKEIEEIRDADINEYWRKGLDKEYSDIIAKQEASSRRRRPNNSKEY